MKNWQKKRQKSLAEVNLVTHILAYLVTVIILIFVANLKEYTFYTSTILLTGTVSPAAVFILIDYHFLQRKYRYPVLLWWNIAKHTLLFIIITMVLASSQREQVWLFGSIYLLPVALSCIALGKRWGTAFAGAASLCIFFLSSGLNFTGNQELGILEPTLVLGSIFFLLAWFLGGILEIEKENSKQLRQERDLIARMMDTSPAGIMVLNRCGNIIYANSRLEQIFKLKKTELQKLLWQKAAGPKENNPHNPKEVFQIVMSEKKPAYNYSGTLDGNEKTAYVSISGAPVFDAEDNVEQVVLTVNDITQQKKINEEILKADKLNSIGLLAGGIAHDFNNFMAVILGNISLVNIRNKDKKISVYLEHMEKAALQAEELTCKLFVFAKGGAPIKKTIYLKNLLKDTIGFILSGSASICKVQIAEDLFPIEADSTQIGQVINNILINAVQAMPEGGKISLTACNLILTDDELNSIPLSPGDYVCITIGDDGIGITPYHLDKIFDPFFSTKPGGSGLGLATAHTIIQNHGGLIQVESQPGMGTTIFIYLPACAGACPETDKNEELYFGSGHILIMDDDELVLKTCGEMLKSLGYQVSWAYHGEEAISLYKKSAQEGDIFDFDAVIMDLTIPGGMGGKEAIKQLRKLNPAVKAIVSSGYSDDPVMANYKEYGFSACLRKPYQIKELSRTLVKIMNNEKSLS
ncbi:hybrid sensor histidine kinase/response regulator [Candidatus Contubernalis alkaliaceticus]|uniref:hybrid sensor histidine kinase/response regulator n=1 Tax=Candidatus Contubernalis alkaliaceticus TaxID=338645 RepID=UPI001F4C0D54|nr:ATP-binding protein [Candidatus Contubernalis alkalaceticus]UNC93031.1 response regulator [Candidatus Contubernalis alkalaceticus]